MEQKTSNQHASLDPQSPLYQFAVQTAVESEELAATATEVITEQFTR